MLFLLAFLQACTEVSPVSGGEDNSVKHELWADLNEGDRNAIEAWEGLLGRLTEESEIIASVSEWRDSSTLFSIVRKLRSMNKRPAFSLVHDPIAYANLPQSLRDSFDFWQETRLMKMMKRKGIPARLNEQVVLFRRLKDPTGGNDSQCTVHMFSDGTSARVLLFVHDDVGWLEAFSERLATWLENDGRPMELSSQITTDQYVQGVQFYPVNFEHFLVDSFLAEMEYGLQSLHRPARVRILTALPVSMAAQHRLGYMKDALDLDVQIVTRSGMDTAWRLTSHPDYHPTRSPAWVPEMVILDGDFGRSDAIARPRRRQIVLLGSLPLLAPIGDGEVGSILWIQEEEMFASALGIWDRYRQSAQWNTHGVEYEGDSVSLVY